ncbi:hypothetical protein KXX54_008125 [Aspergillus fumigatus]|nr:hypothetical protein KXX54_008125 [Aspergillus fumigatus]
MDIEGYCQPLSELLNGYTPSRPFTVWADLHVHISLSMPYKADLYCSKIEFLKALSFLAHYYGGVYEDNAPIFLLVPYES